MKKTAGEVVAVMTYGGEKAMYDQSNLPIFYETLAEVQEHVDRVFIVDDGTDLLQPVTGAH